MPDDRSERSNDHRDETIDPTAQQRSIIDPEEESPYPMRVLAGAGTGKTYTMVRTIERLLDDGVRPGEILVLTFTNKAADSIQQKLAETVPRAYDVDTYTYHAIGEEILRDYAYQAGIDPRYEIATEVQQHRLIFEALEQVPFRFTKPYVADPGHHVSGAANDLKTFLRQMKGEDIGPGELQAYLGDAGRLIELSDVVDRLEEEAEAFDFGRWRKPTVERLEEDMIEPLCAYRDVLAEERAHLADSGLEGDIDNYLADLQSLCSSLVTLFDTRADEIVDDGPLGPAFKLPALLFGAKYDGDATGLPDVDVLPLDRLRTVLEECQKAHDFAAGYEAYEELRDDAGLLDFADLVNETRALFSDPRIADELGERWTYVFCDEFQDTDTVQFELISSLVADGNLFVVGDEYQSIYEWRGANVENITDRIETEFALTEKSLDKNFRSNEPILTLANNLLEQHPGYESIRPLEAGTEQQAVDRGVATIAAPEADSGRGIGDVGEAERIAELISQLVSGESSLVDEADLERAIEIEGDDRPDGYRPEDIAILVRANDDARPIVRELERVGIPYELGGALAAESAGVQTVIEYLRLLSKPSRDGSLLRLLMWRYRVPTADLRTLSRQDGSLFETVVTGEYEASSLRDPGRLDEAAEHLRYLRKVASTHSIAGLYREIKETTRIEWFLDANDREDLRYLDEVVANYEDEPVQPELSEEFIQFLEFNATSVLEGTQSGEPPDVTGSGVKIMTVHKAKGLEFPVTILPQVDERTWRSGSQSNTALRHAVANADGSLFDPSLLPRESYEQRRTFHVAVTRAEQLCVLSGRGSDDDGDEELSRSTVRELLPPELKWCMADRSFPVWEEVRASLPSCAVNVTEEIDAALEAKRSYTVETTTGETLPLSAAYDGAIEAGRAALAGELDALDPDELGLEFSVEPIEPAEADLRISHSYTSIGTYEKCKRRHYLDHVVDAFEDPLPDRKGTNSASSAPRGGGGSEPDPIAVGTLFHSVAESADRRTYETPEERKRSWLNELEGRSKYSEDVKERVRSHVETFFETAARDWTVRSTERWFDFYYDDQYRIVGQIDAICETPEGEVVIVDYKTSRTKRGQEDTYQLPIYVYAAREAGFFGEIDGAAYVYVNDRLETKDRIEYTYVDDRPGTKARLADRSDDRQSYREIRAKMDDLGVLLEEIESRTYETAPPTDAEWCFECAHRGLECRYDPAPGSGSN